MLKSLFGSGRPDHPLADPKEAKRLLDELPGNDPLKALEELAHWHESVSGVEGFRPEDRVSLHFMLEDAAHVRVRKVSRDYLASARPSRFQENRMWSQMYEYWRQAGLAYAKAIDAAAQPAKGADGMKPLVAALAVRALRAFAQQVKWLYLRYGPVDPGTWRAMGAIYAFAESRGIAEAKATVPNLHSGAAMETTPRLEYLRAVLLNVASPDSLLPPEVELVERLVGDLSPAFVLAAGGAGPVPAGASHWIDIGQTMPPQRVVKAPQPAPGVRFFGAGQALPTVQAAAQKLQTTRQVPQSIAAAGFTDPESTLDLLNHLVLYWSPLPPERKHPRHAVKSRLSIVHGYDGVTGAIDTGGLDFGKQAAENWIVENVSAGGFGAVVPQAKGDWLKIGTLLAMQPDGGNNWVVGMVRRVSKISGTEARVGIQTLSRSPEVIRFAIGGAQEAGVLLPSPLPGTGETSIVMRTGLFVPGQNLENERGGRSYVYMPQGVSERGDDYDIVKFREMIREG